MADDSLKEINEALCYATKNDNDSEYKKLSVTKKIAIRFNLSDFHEILQIFREIEEKQEFTTFLVKLASNKADIKFVLDLIKEHYKKLCEDKSLSSKKEISQLKKARYYIYNFIKNNNIDYEFNIDSFLVTKKTALSEWRFTEAKALLKSELNRLKDQNLGGKIQSKTLRRILKDLPVELNVTDIDFILDKKSNNGKEEVNAQDVANKIVKKETEELFNTLIEKLKEKIKGTHFIESDAAAYNHSQHYELLNKKIKTTKEQLQAFTEKYNLNINFNPLNELIEEAHIKTGNPKLLNNKIKETFSFIKDNQVKAYLFRRIQKRRSKYDKKLYNLITTLYLGKLHHTANDLMNFYENITKGKNSDGELFESQKKFVLALEATLNVLSSNPSIDKKLLKKLATQIKHFGEAHNIPTHIHNIDKLLKKGASKEVLDEINKRTEFFKDRKYIYIANIKNEVTDKKRYLRKKKKFFRALSFIISITVGIGEGLVSGVLSCIKLLWFVIAAAISGFLLNAVLFKGTSNKTFEQLFIKKNLFKEEDGQPISLPKKILAGIAIFFAICGGLAFGFLSFASANKSVPKILGKLIEWGTRIGQFFATKLFTGKAIAIISVSATITIPHVLVFILAGVLALSTAIGLGTAFYVDLTTFIKERLDLKIIRYFKEHFIDVFKSENWNRMEFSEKAIHTLQATARALIHGILMSIACAAWIIATLASAPFFGFKALSVIKGIFHGTVKVASIFTDVAIDGLGVPCNSTFYAAGIFKTFYALAEIISHPQKTWRSIKNYWKEFSNDPDNNTLRKVYLMGQLIAGLILTIALPFNGIGYASGPVENINSLQIAGGKIPVLTSGAVGSIGPNFVGATNATAPIAATNVSTTTTIPAAFAVPQVANNQIPSAAERKFEAWKTAKGNTEAYQSTVTKFFDSAIKAKNKDQIPAAFDEELLKKACTL